MENILKSLFASDIFWSISDIFLGAMLLIAAGIYFYRAKKDGRVIISRFKAIAWTIVVGRLVWAGFLTFAQYFVWNTNGGVAKIFLTSAANPASLPKLGFLSPLFKGQLGYFYLYSLEHFWLSAFASILVAYLFYVFLKALKKHKERFFEDGELELGWVMALTVGYPKFIIFLSLIFVFVIAVSIFRLAVFKETLTTLGYPILLSAIFATIWGVQIIDFLGWGGLKV